MYDLASATPTTPVATLSNPAPGVSDSFGLSVAIDGITVVVGAPKADELVEDKGAAYVCGPANADGDGDGLLDMWEFAHFGTATGHDAMDDSDGDGRQELVEQAFNQEPNVPDASASPAITTEGGFLTTTVAKRAGVNYIVQTAADPQPDSYSSATTTVLINTTTTLKVRDNVPVGTVGSRFMRVLISASP